MSNKNDVTGDTIISKVHSGEAKKNYDEAYDRCFGHKKAAYQHWVPGCDAASPKETKDDSPS